MAFDDFDAFRLSQKSRDIIGIHPIVDKIGIQQPMEAAVECDAWEVNFDLICFFYYDFQEIFTMFCESLLLNSDNILLC